MNEWHLGVFVDHGSIERGKGLYRAGHASVEAIDHPRDHVVLIEGSCEGSQGDFYSVTVQVVKSAWGSLQSFSSACSCPVGVGCKHAVALYLAFSDIAEQEAKDRMDSKVWRGTVKSIFEDIQLQDDSLPPATLLVSLNRNTRVSGPGTLSLSVFPARPAKRPTPRKPYATGDITWTRVRNGSNFSVNPLHKEALDDIRSLLFGQHYYDSDVWESTYYPLASLWDALMLAREAGIPVVENGTFKPVIFDPEERPVPIVDLSTDERGWTILTPTIAGVDVAAPQNVFTMGIPSQLAAWHGAEGHLHIAKLAARPPRHWVTLREERKEVRIPPQDRAEFEDEFLPEISETTPWISSDNSFTPTKQEPPQLVAHIRQFGRDSDSQQPSTAIEAHFSFRYARGRNFTDIPVNGESYSPSLVDRDCEAEAALVEKAAAQGIGLDDFTFLGKVALEFLNQGVEDLQRAGIIVEMDEPTISLSQWQEAENFSVSVGVDDGSNDWFSLQVRVLVDGKEVSMAALIAALSSPDRLLFTEDGTFVDVDDPQFDDLVELLEEARALSDPRRKAVRVPASRTSWWDKLEEMDVVSFRPNEFLKKALAASRMDVGAIDIPAGINATLRPYQEEGFRWLAELSRRGMGGVLADDMGLGKTLQVLSMIVDSKHTQGESNPWLVVAPTSVASNWVAEAKKFAPDLKVELITSTSKRRKESLEEVASRADVLVSTYALVRLDADEYASLDLAGVVLDEAQNVKNPASKVFQSIRDLEASRVYAVTGTPIENSLIDAWAMFALTNPGLLANIKQFKDYFERPIAHGDSDRMEALRHRTAPFMLRRRKADVALDLPPIQHQVVQVELDPKHRKAYDLRLNRERQRVLKIIADDPDNKIEVLAALTALRQMAIDPSLVDENSKAPSSKLEHLVGMLGNIIGEGHRVLIFSQFTTYLQKVRKRLDAEGISTSYLDGGTANRKAVIDGFKNGTDSVFLISLKAGGIGLNLTEADYVFMLDPWWNPATEAQAIDRAHRIGQTMPVTVYRLVSSNTIEDRVLALQDKKRELMDAYLAPDSDVAQRTGGMKLDSDSIRELLS